MFTELKVFLNEAAPHLVDLLAEALITFEKLDLPNYQDSYIDALMLLDITTPTMVMDEVMKITTDYQIFLLNAHGIKLVDHTDIHTRTMFLNAVVDIGTYSDTTTLLNTISLPISTNEVFAELVSLVMHKNADELLLEIDKVSTAFIYVLKEHCEEKPEILSTVDKEQKQKYIDSFVMFTDLIGNTELLTTVLLTNGLDVGYPLNTYLSIIGKDLEEMPAKKAATELIAAALISSDGNESPVAIIQDQLDIYFSSIDQITKVSVEVTNLLLKMQRN